MPIDQEHAENMRDALDAIAAKATQLAAAASPPSTAHAFAAMAELARAAMLPPQLHPMERTDTTSDLVTVCSSCKRATC